MNRQTGVASAVALLIGFGGGAATYSWLRASSNGEVHGQEDDHKDHEAGQGKHVGEEQDEHGEAVRLTKAVMDEYGVKVAAAGPGELGLELVLPGEVVVNPDRMVHIVPRVPGIAQKITKSIGDVVEAGELLAVIESAELAEAKAKYLAAKQRLGVARANVAANEELKAKGIVAELEFLATQRELAEARIEQRAAEFKLYALGLKPADLPTIEANRGGLFSTYELWAPLAGTIIDRHISLGELVTPASPVFVLANLSTVWVQLTVYQKDLAEIRAGQPVVVVFSHDIPDAHGAIDYVSPIVEETTRTATARVVLENPERIWRPGLFVHASVQVSKTVVPLRVPMTALLTVGGKTVVFVESADGFRPQPVKVGRSNGTHAEIVEGLEVGQRYVSENAFTLKAEMAKGSFSGHHH